MFSTSPKANFNFWVTLLSANELTLDKSKLLYPGEELKNLQEDIARCIGTEQKCPNWVVSGVVKTLIVG